jgi:plastocyanin
MFVPRQIVINVGDKVMWINKDGDQHTVTGNAAAQRLMRSRPLSSGARYTATFVHGGTFRYHCEFHPFMLGTVKVRAHLAS